VATAHWDETARELVEEGPLAAYWTELGDAAGSVAVGVNRIEILPSKRSGPVHTEGEEEEIFWVLGGSGLSWQEGETYEVGPGDCLVHLAGEHAHTLVAGEEGLDVLAFGMRAHAEMGYLPRAGVMRHGRRRSTSRRTSATPGSARPRRASSSCRRRAHARTGS
jgi:uncharacterized cupin superfamily protein